MLTLHIQEARQCRTETERFGIGSVDSTDHRLGHAFECFFTKPPSHKARETFIANAICAFPRQKKIRSHPQLAADSEYVARHERPNARRREQLKSFRHRPQPPVSNDETASELFVCLDQSRLETESFGEFKCFRFF